MSDETKLIQDALRDLFRAAEALVADTYPQTPLPRPRRFELCKGISWPMENNRQPKNLTRVIVSQSMIRSLWTERHDISARIESGCKTPHEVSVALHNIRAATAWCEARTAGRQRQAQEILRQQARYVEELEAEEALRALK